ncbi:MAG: hypothetical protein ACKOAY_13980 [Haliscomenobacter sp.]
MRRHKLLLLFVLTGLVLLVAQDGLAQCPMCRIAAESNLENGGSQGKGLNIGILYMLATPYLLIGTIGFIWWRNRKKKEEEL